LSPENRQARDYLRDMEERLHAADPPPTTEHDWTWRAQRTLADLVESPKATRLEYGDRYVMPYVAGQYPDSLVQLALVTALGTYGRSKGARLPFERTLRAGVERFYDPNVRTLRRYLPSVGEEKDYDAVDSWYLYHPMLSLALQARHGDRDALDLLLRSVDYGIRAARHFGYAWPVFYNIRDFSVIMQQADGLRPGETDAGGIYAYLMMALHELTGEARFIDEASDALVAADGRGLDLMYQANLTAWGAAASLKLWRHSNDEGFRGRGYYWLANLLRHCVLTELENGCAAHYPTFMGVPCMYNSAYMAPFEDMECFLALGEFLKIGGNELDRSAVTLVQAFRTHARHRVWYYYPDMLPPEIIATEQESGEIDRELSFPLEDLYPNGDAPGQIGQEIYGSGIALIYAAGS
jgi:hypothetical protein